MRKEYDFSQGVRGRHAERYRESVEVSVSHAQEGQGSAREAESGFSGASPNSYAAQLKEGVTQVTLEQDVAAAFPDSESVNAALRLLIRAARDARKMPQAS